MRSATIEHHLPAFQGSCRGAGGVLIGSESDEEFALTIEHPGSGNIRINLQRGERLRAGFSIIGYQRRGTVLRNNRAEGLQLGSEFRPVIQGTKPEEDGERNYERSPAYDPCAPEKLPLD